jgi:hypothetical protein
MELDSFRLPESMDTMEAPDSIRNIFRQRHELRDGIPEN